jgi:coenzyme F420-reducing hydrogenase beta subunit
MFTIIRTQKVQEIFDGIEKARMLKTRPVEEEFALDLLVKLSKRRRKAN